MSDGAFEGGRMDASGADDYRHSVMLRIALAVVLLVLAILSIGISVTVSGYDISFEDTYRIIFDHISGKEMDVDERLGDYIVWEMNLPRALFAVIAGFALAVAGCAMQNVMKNPLADPYTTGISSGACLGMAVAMVLGLSVTGYGRDGVLLSTFIFSLIPLTLMIFILPKRTSSVATLILIGIALTYFFNAVTTVLLVSTSAETLAQIYSWQVGSIANLDWSSIPVTAVATIVGSVVLWFLSKQMNVLALGDDEAKSLGVNVDSYRSLIMIVLSVMIAVVVAYAGIIGFIGLVAPHIVRAFIGSDNRYVIPISGLFGGVFLVFADILCRIVGGSYLPVGVMVSMVGAPIFMYIIIRSRVFRCPSRSMISLGRIPGASGGWPLSLRS